MAPESTVSEDAGSTATAVRDAADRLRPIWSHRLDAFLSGQIKTSTGKLMPPIMASPAFVARYEAMQIGPTGMIATGREILDRLRSNPEEHRVESRPSRVPGYVLHVIEKRMSFHEDGEFRTAWGSRKILITRETAAGENIVGGIIGGTHYVLPEYRGLGLGTDLTLAAFECGMKTVDTTVFYSEGGLASRRAAHRVAVAEALAAGCQVPAEVVADYPEMAARYGFELPTTTNPGAETATCAEPEPAPSA